MVATVAETTEGVSVSHVCSNLDSVIIVVFVCPLLSSQFLPNLFFKIYYRVVLTLQIQLLKKGDSARFVSFTNLLFSLFSHSPTLPYSCPHLTTTSTNRHPSSTHTIRLLLLILLLPLLLLLLLLRLLLLLLLKSLLLRRQLFYYMYMYAACSVIFELSY